MFAILDPWLVMHNDDQRGTTFLHRILRMGLEDSLNTFLVNAALIACPHLAAIGDNFLCLQNFVERKGVTISEMRTEGRAFLPLEIAIQSRASIPG